MPAEKLFFVQLADAPALSMDVLSWSRHFRNFPGQGQLPVAGFLRAVLAAGYRGPLSLEVFNDEFRAAPARLTARDGLRSLLLVEAEARRRPPCRAAARLDGFEFLEFAVDEQPARRARATCSARSASTVPAGTARNPSICTARAQVNLVLNGEPDSAAAEHFQMHGPSVCAMALRVDDAGTRAAPARRRCCARTGRNASAPASARIPALRAPDGTLIYLVEPAPSGTASTTTISRCSPDAPAGAARSAIDHVAQALPVGRMDSFVLFYRAVFGFVPERLWELPDPYRPGPQPRHGQPGSQRPPAAEHLRKPARPPTGRFLSAFAGAGVHHIAFATDDIIADHRARCGARRADAADPGELLRRPRRALWASTSDRLDELQRASTCSTTATTAASSCHAYTETFDDRFFFEIVERRGGYEQYGAANAPVRMAAQAQRHEAERLRQVL